MTIILPTIITYSLFIDCWRSESAIPKALVFFYRKKEEEEEAGSRRRVMPARKAYVLYGEEP
jgi:hypothetical protein